MEILLYIVVVFMAFLIQSISGFGSSLFAVPLLTFLLPLEQVIPILLVYSVSQNAYIAFKDRGHIEFKNIFKELIVIALGLPVGIIFLNIVDENTAVKVLGVIILVIGIMKIVQTTRKIEVVKKKFDLMKLFIGGSIQGAFTTGGPFIAMYYDGKGTSKTEFRGSMCFLWAVINSILILQKIAGGSYTSEILHYIGLGALALIAGTFLGSKLHYKISEYYFSLGIYSLLIFSGISLLVFN